MIDKLIDDWHLSNIPGIEVSADAQSGEIVVRDRRIATIPQVFKGPSDASSEPISNLFRELEPACHHSELPSVDTAELIRTA